MGKQDEAVTGTLCVVDFDAWMCNGSTPTPFLVFKKLVHEETALKSALRRSVTGRVSEMGLLCIFFCLLKSTSC